MTTGRTNGQMNVRKLHSVFRLLFDGTYTQMLTEGFFQNSQRAGAKNLYVWTDPATRTTRMQDDGHGLRSCFDKYTGTTASFDALLMLNDSAYDEKVMAEQNPMGLGFHAVLAHQDTKELTIRSGYASLHLDVPRWWEDFDYRDTIMDRVAWGTTCHPGFSLEVVGWDTDQVMAALDRLGSGYRDLLRLHVNGEERRWSPLEAFGVRIYEQEGVSIDIALDKTYDRETTVNFWGQVVRLDSIISPYPIQIVVRGTAPFDFTAPVRTTVIKNERWRAFVETVKQHLVAWSLRPEHRRHLHPGLADTLAGIDDQWFVKAGASIVGRCVPYREGMFDGDSTTLYQDRYRLRRMLLWHDSLPAGAIFLDDTIIVVDDGDAEQIGELEYGVPYLVRSIEQAGYTPYVQFRYHNPHVLPACHVEWHTHVVATPCMADVYAPGVWWLVSATNERLAELDTDATFIIATESYSEWGEGAYLVIGDDDLRRLPQHLRTGASHQQEWDGSEFWEDDEARAFWEAVSETCARLAGDAIPEGWTVASIRAITSKHPKTIHVDTPGAGELTIVFVDGSEGVYRVADY